MNLVLSDKGLIRVILTTKETQMKELNLLVTQWLEARNIIKGSTPQAQFLKGVEEAGELFEALLVSDKDLLKDAVGDTLVCINSVSTQLGYDVDTIITDQTNLEHHHINNLTLMLGMNIGKVASDLAKGRCAQKSLTFIVWILNAICIKHQITSQECYQIAYDEIKSRKGEMRNGVFVKEEDL